MRHTNNVFLNAIDKMTVMAEKMELEQLQIVLVEPEGPLNVGSVARAMKNFGLRKLVLVNPRCDPFCNDALKMAVHAKDILEEGRIVSSLAEALKGFSRAVATTTRERVISRPLQTPEKAIPWLLETKKSAALLFGNEERGLSNQELQWSQQWMKIPSHPKYPTLNLAQAVALCCYELFRQQPGNSERIPSEEPASLDAMESYLEQLASLLREVGYLHPQSQTSCMTKFRQLLYRSSPSASEMALLRGVVPQIKWALQNAAEKR